MLMGIILPKIHRGEESVPIKYDSAIKKPYLEHEYSIEEISELQKCSEDIWYFLKYVKIVHPDKGRIIFEPREFQKEILCQLLNRRYLCILCPRQVGKTAVIAVYAMWYALFNEDKTIGIVSNKQSSAVDILSRIRIIYEELPIWLKPGVRSWGKTYVEFDNGTRILVSATSVDAFRGRTINLMVCLGGENTIKVRNKRTGVIEDITIEKFYERLKKDDKNYLRKNNDYEIWTDEGWKDFSGVSFNGKKHTGKLIFTDGRQVVSTHNHEFFINGRLVKLEDIVVGDCIDGGNNVVTTNYPHYGIIDVYDVIGVHTKDHSFFINGGVKTKNCDEYAFIRKHIADDFWAANYPTVAASMDAKIVLISTPNGVWNQFHTIYSMGERGENNFFTMKYDWKCVPERDEAWAEEQRRNLGQRRWNQEHLCQFLGSVATVIDPNVLESLFSQTQDPIEIQMNDKFKIYEKPVPGATYTIGCDVAKGTGENYSVAQVLKLESLKPIKMVQVAKFRDNMTDVYKFSEVVDRLSSYYNNAFIMVENNAEGAAVVNRLWWEFENEGLVNSGNKTTDLGIRATVRTKPRAVLLMKKLIEDGSLQIVDHDTVVELSSFIESNNKFFGKDTHDDCVSSLYWGSFIVEMDLFEETFELKKTEATTDEEDGWGVLDDVDREENFDWMTGN